MTEIFKPIKDYEHYEVSNFGTVKATKREFIAKNGKLKRYPEKILTPDTMIKNNTTYLRVTLSKEGKTKKFFVHRLVAETFIPNIENKPFVNHIDNNGLNNNVKNLEWCTHSENMIHAQKQGRLFNAQSLGGKKGSATNTKKALQRFELIKGTQINYWYIDKISDTKRYKNAIDIDVICTLCGTKHVMTLQYIEHNISNCCSKCKNKIKI